MRNRTIVIRFFFLQLFVVFGLSQTIAQNQDDFTNKLQEIFLHASDSTKAKTLARDLYKTVERVKDLQTYSNYYLLKTIFENTAPDAALAKTCGQKAEKLMNAMVGIVQPPRIDSTDSSSVWYGSYFPSLFSNKDPDIARKALIYLDKYPLLKTFTNLNYTAYAFEKSGDFQKAKETYEKAIGTVGDDKKEYRSYIYYTTFLSRTGDYLKAEEYIRKMELLSEQAIDAFKSSYHSESISARVIYYLAVGDYHSYVKASEQQYESILKSINSKLPCDPYPMTRFTTAAFAREMLKDYNTAERLWKSRDSAGMSWVNCHNSTYPNYRQYPLSMYPLFLVKRGKYNRLQQPVGYYIKETEAHYRSYSEYADFSTNFMKATQLGFLGSPGYPALFSPLLGAVRTTRNFRESTEPFSYFAYFSMRDKRYDQATATYDELFKMNVGWINDIIFTFGEKTFVTYYNAKLKEGYQNYHSFVRLAKEKQPARFPQLAGQAYNNLLFTKSISLKGTQKRKEAFLQANDQTINVLYDQWIDRKQQLIRQYFRAAEPAGTDTLNPVDMEKLGKLQEEVNHLETELIAKAKDFKKYLSIPPPDWKTIRDQLKDGEAAVEMIRFQWRDQVYYSDTSWYAAYIITKNSASPDVVYLPSQASDLDNKYYLEYKNNIRRQTTDNTSYNHFWKPINDQLKGIKKIYFSPDGIYHLVNLATLKNPSTNNYLLDELEIIYSLTGTDINLGMVSHEQKHLSTAVLIGRPTYKTGETAAVPVVDKNTRSFVREFRENNIPDLPGTEEEVRSIKKEMDEQKMKVSLYLKEDASEDKLYKLKSPDILHIATHGYWSPSGENATDGYRLFNAMVNSGLLLSGVVNYYSASQYPDTYDGILTAYEAQNLDLKYTSLVVLSACETSLGHLDAGEGVYGLQRAFRAAGAGSVMTSLWKVDDKATRDFMIQFYQHYLKTGNKTAAFQLAQKTIKEKYPQPFYWGAFVMTGE